MASSPTLRARIRRRLDDEVGRIGKEAPFTVALCYPSPYATAMSSLGFQRIYRAIMERPGFACERAFLDDDEEHPEEPFTYESERPLASFPVLALSVAYELQLAGVIRLLDGAKIPALRADRGDRHPLILAGGPLTFSNPLPLAPFVDALVLGEAEQILGDVLDALAMAENRAAQLDALSRLDGVYVPSVHGGTLPPLAVVDDAWLPAWAPIRTPHTEFADMFLIEAERGCSRGCRYCVLRRGDGAGMRKVPIDVLRALIPKDAKRVGLVGAAVSDHPQIVELVTALADEGREVALSSLRPDRLSDPFVAALRKAGYRTLTTAMDGTSERVRGALERRTKEKDLVACTERAKAHGMDRLKLYVMIGVPGEEAADVDECARFVGELSRILPVALGIAPFCAKRNTPLDGAPFAGIAVVGDRLDRLRRALRGRADVRATSAKWAWVEHSLAQGGEAEGLAVLEAVRAGGSFADYKRCLGPLAAPAK